LASFAPLFSHFLKDLEKRSFQIALAANTLDESDSESDSNTPRRVLRRNIKEVLINKKKLLIFHAFK
jgi:hypothetical protein